MTNKCELCDNCVIDNEDRLCYNCFGWHCCRYCDYKFVEHNEDYCSAKCEELAKRKLAKNKKCELCNKPTIDEEDRLCYDCFGWKSCQKCGNDFIDPNDECDCCEPEEKK